MTAPDVLYRHPDGALYDDTRRAWDARQLRPLAPEPKPRPLHHGETCVFRASPDLVDVCPCTRRQRDYRASHPH